MSNKIYNISCGGTFTIILIEGKVNNINNDRDDTDMHMVIGAARLLRQKMLELGSLYKQVKLT